MKKWIRRFRDWADSSGRRAQLKNPFYGSDLEKATKDLTAALEKSSSSTIKFVEAFRRSTRPTLEEHDEQWNHVCSVLIRSIEKSFGFTRPMREKYDDDGPWGLPPGSYYSGGGVSGSFQTVMTMGTTASIT